MMGSHLDTQPEGGRFDGVYGVLAGLEVVRRLNDLNIQTRKPLEIAVWTNEEGARFTPAMFGSAVFTGSLALADALAIRDADGISVADELQRHGYAGQRPLGGQVDACFEAHIEQGPILEDNAKSIGVVSGGQAIRWLDVTVEGMAAHAGTTPMPLRKDALYGTARMIQAVEQLAADFVPEGLTTVGELSIAKSSRGGATRGGWPWVCAAIDCQWCGSRCHSVGAVLPDGDGVHPVCGWTESQRGGRCVARRCSPRC